MPPEPRPPAGLDRLEFVAMGTEIAVLAPLERIGPAEKAVRALFGEWESVLSRFRPESELSRLNERAGRPTAVSSLIYDVVATALAAARATRGAFDPTLLHDLVRLGYDRTFAELPADASPSRRLPFLGGRWHGIRLDSERRQIALPPGAALDVGGIAKGMAVDAALDRLEHELGIGTALVDAGGDLAVRGLPPGERAWHIAIEGSTQPIALRHGALATSGSSRRSWLQDGMRRHHLIDPRTGEPAASGLRSVTVAAATCRQAEAAATAAFVLGAVEGAALLERYDLAGLFVGSRCVEAVGRWPGLQEVAA
ncbi:MAG: FAD:protein FMN transferase [Thermoleophilia bacterium]